MQLEAVAQKAEDAINDFQAASRRHADAVRLEAEMEANRPEAKLAAITRLMQRSDPRYAGKPTDPADGKPVKLMPATEAERYVELDEEYAAYLVNQRNICHARLRTQADAMTARLTAELQIALTKSLAGVA